MSIFLKPIVFILVFVKKVHMNDHNNLEESAGSNVAGTSTQNYVFWPNATVPFYINPEHFDREQSTSIMTTLALFAFKSCLKFLPVLAPPQLDQHVLVIANPEGARQCAPSATGHPLDEPHTLVLGYDCLRPPQIEMMVMKALGFPFEHNRASRDFFIEVQFENVDPSAMELFTKDNILPLELRSLAYDVDSVMHFGERDYSKNGHRTIIFKDRSKQPVTQNRVGLSPLDLRKIEIVYGPECRKRDRQEKIELCQNYPGVARKKREVEDITNLRVNREITPPPKDVHGQLNSNVRELGVEPEMQAVVDRIYKVSAKALSNARAKYCNSTKPDLKVSEGKVRRNNSNNDIVGIAVAIVDFAKNMVDNAIANITVFCQSSESFDQLARSGCGFFNGRPCPAYYKSTKSGAVMYSTKHRPFIYQSTKNDGTPYKHQYHHGRSGNNTEEDTEVTTVAVRRKRHAEGNEGTNKTNEKARRDEENTTITSKGSDNNFKNVTDKDLNSGKKDLRMATERPQIKTGAFVADWPFPERNHRKHFKAVKRARTQKDDWDDSNVSLEDKRERKHRQRERLEAKKGRDGPKRQKNRVLRDESEESQDLDNVPKTVNLSKQNEEFYNERKWPDGVVRYMLSEVSTYDVEDVRRRLAEVNSILKKKTCVKLEEITEDDAKEQEDYLVVDTGADYVTGRVGGRQNFGSLELYRGDQHRQHTAMIVMAMLGFYFELARHDRDKHVRVHLRHVRPDKLHHFEKIRSDATFPLPYDFASATHPAWQFWRKVGKKGISTVATYKSKDPDGEIMKSLGQNEKLLSETDIVKINSVYGIKCFQNTRPKKAGRKKPALERRHQ